MHGLIGAAAFWICAADEQLGVLSPDRNRYDEVRDRTGAGASPDCDLHARA